MTEEEDPNTQKKQPEKMKARLERVQQILDTTAHSHDWALTTAERKHLKNESGEIDYGLLEENKALGKQFAETMADVYVEEAMKPYKLDKETLGDFEKDIVMQLYAGYVQQTLLKVVKNAGKNFREEFHREKGTKDTPCA